MRIFLPVGFEKCEAGKVRERNYNKNLNNYVLTRIEQYIFIVSTY